MEAKGLASAATFFVPILTGTFIAEGHASKICEYAQSHCGTRKVM
jgi:hypothetical protein